MIQQMIISAFSALGLSGKNLSTSSPWYFDSTTSNHMTNNATSLSNINKYLEISKFILLMAVIYLSRPLVMFLLLSLMFLYHLVLPPILYLSVSWLKMIVNWNFPNLVVLCKINSQGG